MTENTKNPISSRCRIVLITPDIQSDDELIAAVRDALSGGDVASVIIPQYERDDASYLSVAKTIIEMAQELEIACFVVDNTQVMGRSGADGLHFTGNLEKLRETRENLAAHGDKHMFGIGGLLDRHRALSVGECQPDYIMFGKVNSDIKDDAHPKNIALGEWWASMIEIPAVVMGGRALNSVVDVAKSRAEFVALNFAIFNNDISAGEAVAKANA